LRKKEILTKAYQSRKLVLTA